MLIYASDRVTSRGANTGGGIDPDIVETPGFNFDIGSRQALDIEGLPPVEMKVEARNLLGTAHKEVQDYENYQVQVNTYDIGTTVSVSFSVSL